MKLKNTKLLCIFIILVPPLGIGSIKFYGECELMDVIVHILVRPNKKNPVFPVI
jgi:hypothetical protein